MESHRGPLMTKRYWENAFCRLYRDFLRILPLFIIVTLKNFPNLALIRYAYCLENIISGILI